jgi:hypothetical protein
MMMAARRAPHLPGPASNDPGHGAPQEAQAPSASSPQAVIVYQSRPISREPQAWQ